MGYREDFQLCLSTLLGAGAAKNMGPQSSSIFHSETVFHFIRTGFLLFSSAQPHATEALCQSSVVEKIAFPLFYQPHI